MKYGVIICPSCGRARGMETSKKTTTCPCGRRAKLHRSSFKSFTDSPRELAEMVAQANQQLADGKKVRRRRPREPKDQHLRIASQAASVKDPVERAETIARMLTESQGDFGVEDLRRVLKVMGKGSPEEMVDRLVRGNMVYEVGEGRYRSV